MISAAVLNERLFYVCRLTMKRQYDSHTNLIPAFPHFVAGTPPSALRWPSVPNQTSTTGKNLIIAHPDSVAMDDAFLSRF